MESSCSRNNPHLFFLFLKLLMWCCERLGYVVCGGCPSSWIFVDFVLFFFYLIFHIL